MSLEVEEGMVIGILLSVVLYVLYRTYFSNLSIDSVDIGPVGKFVKSILLWFANILPFTILIYGIAGDIINQTGVKLALPSIVALVSMTALGIGGQLWGSYAGGLNLNTEETYGSFWCTIPGLERLESPYIPTAFLATSLIAFYYLTWAWAINIPSGKLATFFGITLVVQLSSYLMGGCSQSYASIAGPGGLLNVIIPIIIGVVLGSVTAGSAMATNESKAHYNPFTPTANGATGGGLQGSGQPPPKDVSGHSQPVQDGGDENTFVAELYKNGELVTPSLAN